MEYNIEKCIKALNKYAGKKQKELTQKEMSFLKESAEEFKHLNKKIYNHDEWIKENFSLDVQARFLDAATEKKVRDYYWGKFFLNNKPSFMVDLITLSLVKINEGLESYIDNVELHLVLQIHESKASKNSEKNYISKRNQIKMQYYLDELQNIPNYFAIQNGTHINSMDDIADENIQIKKVIPINKNYTIEMDDIINGLHELLPLYKELTQMYEETVDNSISINKNIMATNILFYGAPGTGKSYGIKRYIEEEVLDGNKINLNTATNVFRTMFHPDYMYSDFVGQIMPVLKGENVAYEFVPGTFTKALEYAYNNPHEPVFLILEELSRADCSAVFGDIFQLLDRDEKGQSEYPINHFQVVDYLSKKNVTLPYDNKINIPSNLFLIGTMNPSDQNVKPLDTAFKRRFEMRYCSTTINEENMKLNNFDIQLGNISFKWNTFVNTVNQWIVSKLNLPEDKQLGQWFLKDKNDDRLNCNQFVGKVLYYLYNDVENAAKFGQRHNQIFAKDIKSFADIDERVSKLKEGNHSLDALFNAEFLEEIDLTSKKEVSRSDEEYTSKVADDLVGYDTGVHNE